MATWKKVIVSGSAAELSSLTASGNITASAFYGDGSGLTGVAASALDIDAFGSDLTAITVAGTDKLALSDNGTEGRINVSQLATPLATPLAGTGLEANSGTVRIAGAAAGNGLTGGAGSALAVGAGTHITVNPTNVAVNTSTLLPALSGSILTTVSGDIAITAAGVATIQANSVALGTDTTGDYVASFTAGSGLTGDATGEGSTPTLAVGAGNYITVNANDVAVNTTTLIPAISGSILTTVSGDISITAGGVATIPANSVALATDTTGNYVATLANATNGGITVTNGSTEGGAATVAVNLNDLSAAAVSVANDSIAIIDASATNATRKESIADLVSGIAGTNLTASSGQLSLATTISGNPTFSGNVIVSGDLTVNGSTTTVSTTNITVEDRFIILNYGSGSVAPAGEGGIIVEGGTGGEREAWFFDQTKGRWGVASGVSNTATSVTQAASSVLVYEGTTAAADSAGYNDVGNMAIASGDIYIYV